MPIGSNFVEKTLWKSYKPSSPARHRLVTANVPQLSLQDPGARLFTAAPPTVGRG
jgi:hypothetical protein